MEEISLMDVRFAPLPNFRSPVFRRKLFVSLESIFLRRSYFDGLQDLRMLASKATQETVWLHVAQRGWFCISDAPIQPTAENDFAQGCFQPIFDFSRLGKEINHAHIHPDKLFANYQEKLFQRAQNNPGLPLAKAVLSVEAEKIHFLALPSQGDLRAFQKIQQFHLGANAEIRFLIVTKWGITTMALPVINRDLSQDFETAAVAALEKAAPQFMNEPMSSTDYIHNLLKEVNQRLYGVLLLSFSAWEKA